MGVVVAVAAEEAMPARTADFVAAIKACSVRDRSAAVTDRRYTKRQVTTIPA